jgi:hypothetical protein
MSAEPAVRGLTDSTGRDRRVGRHLLGQLAQRWPTWLAIGLSLLSWGGARLSALAEVLLLFPLGYLAVLALGRRGISWPAAIIGIGAVAGLRFQDRIEPAALLLASGVVLVLYAVARRRFWPPADGIVQAAGWLGFVALAYLSVTVDPQLGKIILAGGWFGHALWDLYHWLKDKGVSRSFAEWCGVFDFFGAIAILTFPVQ